MAQSAILERGDVLVFAINTDLGSCGDFTGQDEISFVCLKDITSGTTIDFTDNGWERTNLAKWGDSEGVIRASRVGGTIPAGTLITLRTTSDGLFTAVLPDNGWSFTALAGSSNFDLSNNGDQLFIMQNGNWANPMGMDNATYSGDVLFAITTNSLWLTDGSENQSNLYPYLDCFSVTSSNGTTQSLKYSSQISAVSKKAWVERVKDNNNWQAYGIDCSAYNSTFPVYGNGLVIQELPASFDKGLWKGNKSKDWFECDNWDNLTTPDANTNVVITNATINPVEINATANARCNDLLIESQDVSVLGNNSSLTVNGNLIVAGQGKLDFTQATGSPSLKLKGDMFVSQAENFVAGNSSLVMSGEEQVLSGNSAIELNNLQLALGTEIQLESVDLLVKNELFLNQHSKLILQGNSLMLDNPSPSAIIRFADSYIISETEPGNYGKVIWNIGNRLGDYQVPFGSLEQGAAKDLTFKYSIRSLGTGAAMGAVKFATYPTNAQNQPLPIAINQLTNDFGKDNSHHVLDRFWIVENGIAQTNFINYPTIEYTFKYNEDDWNDAANKIREDKLVAQRYNPEDETWQDWLYSPTPLTISNTLHIELDDKNDYHDIWTLADDSDPLPIELKSFSANCDNGVVGIEWTTASETNNNLFAIERSRDGETFEQILEVPGSNNSNYIIDYKAEDDAPLGQVAYYRLKQVDYDGTTDYSDLVGVQACVEMSGFTFQNLYTDGEYINGVIYSDLKQDASLQLYDAQGQVITDIQAIIHEGYNQVTLPLAGLSQGVYFLSFQGQFNSVRQAVFVP